MHRYHQRPLEAGLLHNCRAWDKMKTQGRLFKEQVQTSFFYSLSLHLSEFCFFFKIFFNLLFNATPPPPPWAQGILVRRMQPSRVPRTLPCNSELSPDLALRVLSPPPPTLFSREGDSCGGGEYAVRNQP